MAVHTIDVALAHQAELRAVRRATRGSGLLGLGASTVTALVLATAATAAPGDPDPTFGTGGVAVVADGGSGYGITVQPDGRIVGVGAAGGSTGDGRAFRLNRDGSADTAFGRRLLDVPGHSDVAVAVAVQPDGKIVAAGRTSDQEDIAVWRLLPGGGPDTGFGGGDGVTTVSFDGGDFLHDLAIAPDGRIVLVGSNDFSSPFVARLTATGDVDATFDLDGRLTFATGTVARGVAVQPDGKILVTGDFGAGDKVVLYRLTTTGSPDPVFGGGDGFTDTVTGQGTDVAVQPDGRIVVAGLDFRVAKYDGLVVRYQSGGDLDPTFGSAGQASVDLGGSEGFTAVAPTPDGGVVASGYTDAGGIVAKLDADGRRSPAFGLEGVRVLTGLTPNGVEEVVVGPGGTVVAIGRPPLCRPRRLCTGSRARHRRRSRRRSPAKARSPRSSVPQARTGSVAPRRPTSSWPSAATTRSRHWAATTWSVPAMAPTRWSGAEARTSSMASAARTGSSVAPAGIASSADPTGTPRASGHDRSSPGARHRPCPGGRCTASLSPTPCPWQGTWCSPSPSRGWSSPPPAAPLRPDSHSSPASSGPPSEASRLGGSFRRSARCGPAPSPTCSVRSAVVPLPVLLTVDALEVRHVVLLAVVGALGDSAGWTARQAPSRPPPTRAAYRGNARTRGSPRPSMWAICSAPRRPVCSSRPSV